jgi:hypothetical protein
MRYAANFQLALDSRSSYTDETLHNMLNVGRLNMLPPVILVYVLIAIILGLFHFKTVSKALDKDPLMKALLPPGHIRLLQSICFNLLWPLFLLQFFLMLIIAPFYCKKIIRLTDEINKKNVQVNSNSEQ